MQLEMMTWLEVEAYLETSDTIILPTGSTEQHGPMGLIGTDTLCAREVAIEAAKLANVIVAPALAYTPAPFNMAFPGTLSVSVQVFSQLAGEVLIALQSHGFRRIYILNGHGANIEPLKVAIANADQGNVSIRSWWDFPAVQSLRQHYYGDWEGMHATPSEVAITQAIHRVVPAGIASDPPEKLNDNFIKTHAGDRHGPPEEHRAAFPDGRVGSHSALARPEQGQILLQAAAHAVAEEISEHKLGTELN
jgi:creatinine amidohydrolase